MMRRSRSQYRRHVLGDETLDTTPPVGPQRGMRDWFNVLPRANEPYRPTPPTRPTSPAPDRPRRPSRHMRDLLDPEPGSEPMVPPSWNLNSAAIVPGLALVALAFLLLRGRRR